MTGTKSLGPNASVLIESLRDIGYTLATAVADIIDNSIAAQATAVELLVDTVPDNPVLGIIDNGTGMTTDELHDAMRFGSRDPREQRASTDLGRFGLGLKTASLSQCRRLTVVTRKSGTTSCATWDLDHVARSGKWLVQIDGDTTSVPWTERIGKHGTLVLWQNLDRNIYKTDKARSHFKRQISETIAHLELVFHRYLAFPKTHKRHIEIVFNDRKLEPFNPFNLDHPATQIHPKDIFMLKNAKIRIQPITLPHHSKVSSQEWEKYSGVEGYVKNQGFYVYRNDRLIVHGTWFGLLRQSEVTKLARVQIDVPNSLDQEWKLDVRKASAQPPPLVRERLKKLTDSISNPSKRTFAKRAARLTEHNRLPVWLRLQTSEGISYELNIDHPVVERFQDTLEPQAKRQFRQLMTLFSTTLPIDAFIADSSQTPKDVRVADISDELLDEFSKLTFDVLAQNGITSARAHSIMQSSEPFKSNWSRVVATLQQLSNQGVNDG